VISTVVGALIVATVPAVPALALPGPVGDCPPQHGVSLGSSVPWAQQSLGFSSVWGFSRGKGVTVAVIDSGVDANPQFGHRVIEGPDLSGQQFGEPDGADCVGHGTAVASIIAAAPMTGVSFSGVAPAATILSIKVTDVADAIAPSAIAEAIRDAVSSGASVINLSLATTQDSGELRTAVDFALASNVVVVAAAGNDDGSGTGPFYPAAYPGVLSVGAVGQDGTLASFSDTRTPVTLTAPGVDVTTAYPGVFPDAYDPSQSGTSFATAFVSGVVALVRADHPGWDQAQVVARVKATADGAAGPGTGSGMVDPVQAVTAVLPGGTGSGGVSLASAGQPVPITRADPAGRGTLPLTVAAISAGAAILVIGAAFVVSAGRRRV
jgi:membrane-anchored mycosin MYCP